MDAETSGRFDKIEVEFTRRFDRGDAKFDSLTESLLPLTAQVQAHHEITGPNSIHHQPPCAAMEAQRSYHRWLIGIILSVSGVLIAVGSALASHFVFK
jgi:hypothetical protein